MTWILAAVIAAAFVEIFLALPLRPAVGRLLATTGKARRVIGSPRISDHWKEKTLIVYAGRLLRHSLTIFGLLVCAFAAVSLIGYVMTLAFDSGLPAYMLSLEGTAFATAASMVYAIARFRLVPRRL